MPDGHPRRVDLERFLLADLPPEKTREIVHHLLAGCSRCRRITSSLWPASPAGRGADGRRRNSATKPRPGREIDFQKVYRRLLSQEVRAAREKAEARELEIELERHPHSRQIVLASNSRRFHTWPLCERLLDKAHDLGFRDPARAVETAEVARAISVRLDLGIHGEPLVKDIQARACGLLGNARRINSDLRGAEAALREAEALLDEGTGDPMEEARFRCFQGYLRQDQRLFREATCSFDRARLIYSGLGDDHKVGECLVDKGTALGGAGDLSQAIELLKKGSERMDPARNPRGALAAGHNLSLFLQESGDLEHALSALKEILPLYAEQGDEMNLLRLRWLEGRLAQAQREFGRAEEAFLEVRRGFFDHAIPYDAALVSLDLAAVYVETGRISELKELAARAVEVFRSLEVPRETLAALALFHRAAESEAVTLGWIGELARFIERAQKSPGAPFSPPASIGD